MILDLFCLLLGIIRRLFFIVGILWLLFGVVGLIMDTPSNNTDFIRTTAYAIIPALAFFFIGTVFPDRLINGPEYNKNHINQGDRNKMNLLEKLACISSIVAAVIALLSFVLKGS
jgi:uncharacterized membrane protein YbaN (DUF454 family)